MTKKTQDFIPTTLARDIGGGVFFRPIRSWHSGVWAGERLEEVQGDKSGCIDKSTRPYTAAAPLTYTHRVYWHERDKTKTISAFLSYLGGMSSINEYFWETYGMGSDVERWLGDNAEMEMEMALRVFFNSK